MIKVITMYVEWTVVMIVKYFKNQENVKIANHIKEPYRMVNVELMFALVELQIS